LGITIPTRTITIDGQAEDWAGIDPMVLDNNGDSSCGQYSDITYVFLTTDNSFLYWRIDTNSGNYDTSSYPPVVRFLSHQPRSETRDGDIESSVWEDSGRVDVYNETIHEWDDRYLSGDVYGLVGEVAEGKIPLTLFDSETFTFCEAFIYNRPAGGGTCDEIEVSQSSSGGSGGSSGGGCFIDSIKTDHICY